MSKPLHTALITGLPGSAKTLLLVEWLRANAESENPRPVFTNVKGLNYKLLRCFPLQDPRQITLDNYPVGSVFAIDECQHFYPPRSPGAKKPPEIALFEERRHSGYDFILLTQHPKLLDKNVRVLISDHYHSVRPFDAEYRNVFHWPTVCEDPEPNQNPSTAIVEKKPFDKTLYPLYKSSQLHTMKRRIPLKPFITIACCFSLIGCAGVYVVNKMTPDAPEVVQTEKPKQLPASTSNPLEEPVEDAGPRYVAHVRKKDKFGVSDEVWFEYAGRTYSLSDFSMYSFSAGLVTLSLDGQQVVFSVPSELKI